MLVLRARHTAPLRDLLGRRRAESSEPQLRQVREYISIAMWDVIAGYVFCVLLGLGGLVTAGWLVVTGRVAESTDNLFLTLVSLLLAVASFGFLIWHARRLLSEHERSKKPDK